MLNHTTYHTRRSLAVFAAFLTLVSLLSPAVGAQEAGDWRLRHDDDGIRVSVRSVPGTRFRAYRAEITLSARLQTLAAIIDDVDLAEEWVHYTADAELIRRIDAQTTLVRFISDLPWPASDRDSVTLNRLSQDPDTLVVRYTIDSMPDEVPEDDRYVRVPALNGFWEITPRGDGTVDVVYSIQSDPGGSIPASIVNAGIVTQPFRTLQNLRELVDDPRYRNISVPGIREP